MYYDWLLFAIGMYCKMFAFFFKSIALLLEAARSFTKVDISLWSEGLFIHDMSLSVWKDVSDMRKEKEEEKEKEKEKKEAGWCVCIWDTDLSLKRHCQMLWKSEYSLLLLFGIVMQIVRWRTKNSRIERLQHKVKQISKPPGLIGTKHFQELHSIIYYLFKRFMNIIRKEIYEV